MNYENSMNEKKTNFEFEEVNRVGVFRIADKVFEAMTDLSENNRFFAKLDEADKNKNLQAILIITKSGGLGADEYKKFVTDVRNENNDETNDVDFSVKKIRQIVVLNNFIRKITQLDKLIFIALQGEVVTPFFGASLSSDYRFASEDVTFSLSHLKIGVHPAGALPYFLPKFVGNAKASEILFSGKDLKANDALDLGLVGKVYPIVNFERQCLQQIAEMTSNNNEVLTCTKKLLNHSIKDLEDYISMEECNFIHN